MKDKLLDLYLLKHLHSLKTALVFTLRAKVKNILRLILVFYHTFHQNQHRHEYSLSIKLDDGIVLIINIPFPVALLITGPPDYISGSPGLKRTVASGLSSICTSARFPYCEFFCSC